MSSEVLSESFCRASLGWVAAIEDTKSLSINDISCLWRLNHILMKFLTSQTKSPFDYKGVVIKKSQRLLGHKTFQVSELLKEQADSLYDTVFVHMSEARARGANSIVNARLSSIYRSLNLERLAIFSDKAQVLLALELLLRIGLQTGTSKDMCKKAFNRLEPHHREAIQLYLNESIQDVFHEDEPLTKIEEIKRQTNVHLTCESMKMDQQVAAYKMQIDDLKRTNVKLRKIRDRINGDNSDEQMQILSWDLQLVEKVLFQTLSGDLNRDHHS